MKYLMTFPAVLVLVILPSCLQKLENENIPKEVRTSFELRYPDVEEVSWELDANADWVAQFSVYNTEYLAKFNLDGDWLETDHKIITAAVPFKVNLSLHDHFKDYKIEHAMIAEKKTGQFYEMQVLAMGHEYDIEADTKGTLTREVELN